MSSFETAFFKGASGPFRDYLGKYSGRLLILGDGRTVWDDLKAYGKPDHVMGVKFAGAVYPNLQHWGHLHAEQWPILDYIRKVRAGRHKGCTIPVKHGYNTDKAVSWPVCYGGNSALFCALIAVAMGYDEITLAGCPSDGTGHYYEPPGMENRYSGFEGRGHEKNWKYCRDNYFGGKVRSLSGNTCEWLSSSPAT